MAACGRSSRHEAQRDPGGGGLGAGGGNVASGGNAAKGGRAGSAAGGSSGTAGSSGTEAGAAGSPDNPELGSVVLEGAPFYTRVQRLTASQWEHAVTDILRFPEPQGLSRGFVPPVPLTYFDNNERVLYVDATNVMDFELGAEAAAAIATGSETTLAALYDGNDPSGFVRTLGRRAFRRPLTEAEESSYGTIFARGEELYGAGFPQGAALVIRAMLESAHFLYRSELGPAGDPLDGYELASKLSFWLLDTTPSDALLDAAAAGELDDEQGLEAAARAMLDAPAAVEVMRDFHGQLLSFDAYASLDKANVVEFDPAILPELDAASTAFFDRIFQSDLGLREIFTSKDAYIGPGLAPFYGVTAPASGIELFELDASRSGYIMQAPFLMLWADGTASSPIRRGVRLQRMLCGMLFTPAAHTPPPPPPSEGQTTREAVTSLTQACGVICHATQIDPLGFALENFDGLGRARSEDNGKPVDTSGSYPFAEGVRQFADGTELMSIMADSMQTHTCYSKNVAEYALGRDMVEDDRPLLEGLGQVSSSHSLRELALALVRDPAFRSRTEVAP